MIIQLFHFVIFYLLLFSINSIPYRIVFAVATQDSILFYDSQQAIPFGYVSNLHYLRLTDLSWSPDGRILIITSTDGFSSFVVFDEQELGKPYEGKLMDFEEIDPANLSMKTPNKINNNSPNKSANKTKSPNQHTPKSKPKCSTPITEFFRKSSPSLSKAGNNNNNNRSLLIQSSSERPQQQQQSINSKPGRRVQLITLQTPNNNNPSVHSPAVINDDKSESDPNKQQNITGIKRKQSEDSSTIITIE